MTEKFETLDQVVVHGHVGIFTIIDVRDGEYVALNGYDNVRYCLNPELNNIRMYRKHIKVDIREKLKMYVVVRDIAPIGLGINSIGHVVSDAMENFDSDILSEWKKYSNKQVSCIASEDQFNQIIVDANECGLEYILFTEPDWRDYDDIISVAFTPDVVFPDSFRELKLHGGKHLDEC